MPRYCTIPAIFGLRKWFESRFSDLCQHHDLTYEARHGTRRRADLELYAGMVKRGYPLTGVLSYLVIRAIGWYWWKT